MLVNGKQINVKHKSFERGLPNVSKKKDNWYFIQINSFKGLAELSNAYSCAQVKYETTNCLYNPKSLDVNTPSCYDHFDPAIITCDTPGLNFNACINVTKDSLTCKHFYFI
jgi:hypothetical protein